MNNKIFKLSPASVLLGIKKVPWILGRYAFPVVIFLIALDLVLGVVVIYNYIFLVKVEQLQITESPSAFKSDIYKEILKEWQSRDQRLQNNKIPGAF